jgi:hypothetical protein
VLWGPIQIGFAYSDGMSGLAPPCECATNRVVCPAGAKGSRVVGGSGNPHGHGIMDEIVGNRHVAGQRDHAVIAPNLPPRSSSVLAMAIYAATRMRHEFTSRTTTSSSLSRHLVSSHLFAPIVLAGGRPHGILQIALLETRKNKIFPRRH